MGPLAAAAASALYLGVLTSISPCPLATNVAAMSYVAKHVGRGRRVLAAGLLYTLGRTVVYVVLAAVVVGGLLQSDAVSRFLQAHMKKLLGPVLIVVGVLLLDLLDLALAAPVPGERAKRLAERGGVWGAAPLGILFALSFCPPSAALFFVNLVGLCIGRESWLLLPAVYGVGTALPVVAFAGVIAAGAGAVGRVFDAVRKVERWARLATGVLFVVLGLYYSLVHIWGLKALQLF